MVTADDIKNMHSMREIVEKYGFKINRQGFIRCPFHKEDTASFKVYDKSYYCFGCRESGDIFSFVQKMENIDFKESFEKFSGGQNQNSYKNMIRTVPAHKKVLQDKKNDELLKEKFTEMYKSYQLSLEIEKLYQKYCDRSDKDSDVYRDCYNALQYQIYISDVILNSINDLLSAAGKNIDYAGMIERYRKVNDEIEAYKKL